uniref:Ovule protein n=1 Tax=Steinernema glaseri TaxID=37863 RepID=A0A1I8A3D6_9BILA
MSTRKHIRVTKSIFNPTGSFGNAPRRCMSNLGVTQISSCFYHLQFSRLVVWHTNKWTNLPRKWTSLIICFYL